MRRLAYLFPTFPVLHQTFTVGEVLGLQRRGYQLGLFSLKPSGTRPQQPEAERLVSETHYCPGLFSAPMRGALWRALRGRPRDLVGLVAAVWQAWRAYVPERPNSGDAETTMGWFEKARAVYHCNPWVYLAKSLTMIPYALYLAEVFERERITHVHAHWATYPATTAWLVRRWAGIPYSFTAHAYDIHMVQQMLPAKLEEASFVATCAEANKRFLATLCNTPSRDRIYVNYHGTDLDRFVPRPRDQDDDEFRVVTCGSLEEYKGFHYLIDALAILSSRGVRVSCDMAGDGPQRAVLEAKIRAAGLQDRVRLHGFVDQGKLAAMYARADAFVMPSIVLGRFGKQDVIPNVLAEAMACGVPVIGSDIAGIPELIEDGRTGLLVPQRDAAALAAAIERVRSDPEEAARLAAAGREKIAEIWDRRTNLDAFSHLLNTFVAAEAA